MTQHVALTHALRTATRAARDAYVFAQASVDTAELAAEQSSEQLSNDDEQTSAMIVAILESRRAYLIALTLAEQLLLRNDPRAHQALNRDAMAVAGRSSHSLLTRPRSQRMRARMARLSAANATDLIVIDGAP